MVHPEITKGSPRAIALNDSGVEKIHNFQAISRRVSEMVQDRTKVAIDRKSHTRFRFMPKSTTFDDLERTLRILF